MLDQIETMPSRREDRAHLSIQDSAPERGSDLSEEAKVLRLIYQMQREHEAAVVCRGESRGAEPPPNCSSGLANVPLASAGRGSPPSGGTVREALHS